VVLQNWDNKEIKCPPSCKPWVYRRLNNTVSGDFWSKLDQNYANTQSNVPLLNPLKDSSRNFFRNSIQATKLGSQIRVQKIYVKKNNVSNFDKEAGGGAGWFELTLSGMVG
jgi:hypothetical protein